MKTIAFDGPDFVGKTTLIDNLANYLTKQGQVISIVKEPGNEFKSVFVPSGNEIKDALSFTLNREQIIKNLIIKNYLNNYILCDRTFVSSLMYQSSDEVIFEINRMMFSLFFFKYDYLILLKMSKETLDKRISQTVRHKTDFDEFYEKSINTTLQKYNDFYDKLNKFPNLLNIFAKSIYIIDVDNKTEEELVKEVLNLCDI